LKTSCGGNNYRPTDQTGYQLSKLFSLPLSFRGLPGRLADPLLTWLTYTNLLFPSTSVPFPLTSSCTTSSCGAALPPAPAPTPAPAPVPSSDASAMEVVDCLRVKNECFDAFLWSRSRRPRPRNLRVRFARSSLWMETAMVDAGHRRRGKTARTRGWERDDRRTEASEREKEGAKGVEGSKEAGGQRSPGAVRVFDRSMRCQKTAFPARPADVQPLPSHP
jgi:hypothetical protein